MVTNQEVDEPSSSSDGFVTTPDKEFEVKLYNNKGELVRSQKCKNEKSLKMNTHDLANGLYYLHITNDKEVVKNQIMIQH